MCTVGQLATITTAEPFICAAAVELGNFRLDRWRLMVMVWQTIKKTDEAIYIGGNEMEG